MGDSFGVATTLVSLALPLIEHTDPAQAVVPLEEAVGIAREIGSKSLEGTANHVLGEAKYHGGERAAAKFCSRPPATSSAPSAIAIAHRGRALAGVHRARRRCLAGRPPTSPTASSSRPRRSRSRRSRRRRAHFWRRRSRPRGTRAGRHRGAARPSPGRPGRRQLDALEHPHPGRAGGGLVRPFGAGTATAPNARRGGVAP